MRGAVIAAAIAAACLGIGAAAQTGGSAVGARQLYETLGNTPAMDAFQGRTIQLSGELGHVGPEEVNLGYKGVQVATCDVTSLDPRLAALHRTDPVTVSGTVFRIFHGSTGRFELRPCTFVSAGNAAPAPKAVQAPTNPPMGDYAVYQGGGFSYQYGFRLLPGGRYLRIGGSAGAFSYDPARKVLRFTSGPLQGFVGLYYTRGRNNDEGKPAIALDSEGRVPDLVNASNGQYGYAYFRPEGLK